MLLAQKNEKPGKGCVRFRAAEGQIAPNTIHNIYRDTSQDGGQTTQELISYSSSSLLIYKPPITQQEQPTAFCRLIQ